ncbi:MAG TPA: hypothetical protein VEV81_09010 [Pyrinomonadaceae bacterium]|nr:hypothetical protein [Pyrinomonadaceae bacterium]
MSNPQIWNLVLVSSAALTVCCLGACLMLLRKARRETQDCLALSTQLGTELTEISRDLDTISCRATGQARRIAWLESRVRNGSAIAPVSVDDVAAVQVKARPTITERRHRVMQLNERGVDCNTIASMLNMPHGEVELMVGLSHVN